MADSFQKYPLRARVITVLVLALVLFELIFVSNYPYIIEQYYSNKFYRAFCILFHPAFNLVPFSVGDFFYILVVAYLVYAAARLVRLLIGREWWHAGNFVLGLVIACQVFILCFYLFWGMNYYRQPAAQRLKLNDSGSTATDLRRVTAMLIDSANKCRQRISDADLEQDNKTIYQTAVKAVMALSENYEGFHAYRPAIKPSTLTPLINYMGTSGYYNPYTGEAQMDYNLPVFLKPFVACHEMSHQMGFAPEDEANFAGYMAGVHSSDRLLRYSAYYLGVQEFMFTLWRQDSVARKTLIKRISPSVMNDFKIEREYWLSYQSKLGVLSSLFYDDFLKANNQPQGLDTYNQMVRLVMGWYRKNRSIQ